MTYQLFIDDERFPADHEKEKFLIVRSSVEAKELMDTKGVRRLFLLITILVVLTQQWKLLIG